MLVLVTGGARSGKSSFAEAFSSKLGKKGVYIATAQAYDEEMQARIGLHRRQREDGGFAWETVERPYALTEVLQELFAAQAAKVELSGSTVPLVEAEQPEPLPKQGEEPVILVDCLTLWLSNWLLRYEQHADAEERTEEKINDLKTVCALFAASESKHLVLVTNEVGYGLVPEYKLGRQFRDLSGRMNRLLAQAADQVFLVTAGIPVELTRIRYEL